MDQDSRRAGAVVRPVPRSQRIVTLDVLRGFALLGILLVNIELFRGPVLWDAIAGEWTEHTGIDAVVQFAVGWLASGKFLSSFAILFGVGAAIIGGRAVQAGRSPRGLLARRYAWLIVFGLVHMFALFSGDILFLYGLAGLALVPFVFTKPRTMLWWSGGILAAYLLVTVGFTALSALAPQPTTEDPFTRGFTEFAEERREQTVIAYTRGGPVAQIGARAWEVVFTQGGQLFSLPWVVALFLFGFAVGKHGFVAALSDRSRQLRRAAVIGLGIGLPLNLPLGAAGILGASLGVPGETSSLLLVSMAPAQIVGAPLLAVGYLSALALACRSAAVRRRLAPLEAAGRMALSGYVLQSVLATGFFAWLGYYDRLGTAQALVVVVAIWIVVLAVCSVWQRHAERGPLELLWRRLTYGRNATARRIPSAPAPPPAPGG